MKRPISITVISILFIVAGGWAGIQIVLGLLNDHIILNFNILMILIGLALLFGTSWSRGLAKFWIGMYALAAGSILVLYPFFGDSFKVDMFGVNFTGASKHVVALGWSFSVLILARWMWRSLSSNDAALFFGDSLPPHAEQDVDPNILLK